MKIRGCCDKLNNMHVLANKRDIYFKLMLLKAISKIGEGFGQNTR
jgi:hypothetical protein|tara:strand:- start:267 stop:401 length:135 start_codon:yes stop_codon:yes gene_type:complete